MAQFLFEIFCEEIPARMQARAEEDLARLMSDRLKEAGLKWDSLDGLSQNDHGSTAANTPPASSQWIGKRSVSN